MDFRRPILILIVLVLLSGCGPVRRKPQIFTSPCGLRQGLINISDFKNGVNFVDDEGIGLISRRSIRSMKNAGRTHINWVAIVVTGFQNSIKDTEIYADPSLTPTPKQVVTFAQKAKESGLRVMLKFHIDPMTDYPLHWRGEIGLDFTEEKWDEWFSNYHRFITRYLAGMPADLIDMVCIGNELTSTERHGNRWRRIIIDAKQNFSGPFVYAANWSPGPETIDWWDALDYIGVSAYWNMTKGQNPSVESIVNAWQTGQHVSILEKLSAYYKKPVLFTEIGYRSAVGAGMAPWAGVGELGKDVVDLSEQANLYLALHRIAETKPWLNGIFWWCWNANPKRGGINDANYTPHRKPAEKLLPLFSCIK